MSRTAIWGLLLAFAAVGCKSRSQISSDLNAERLDGKNSTYVVRTDIRLLTYRLCALKITHALRLEGAKFTVYQSIGGLANETTVSIGEFFGSEATADKLRRIGCVADAYILQPNQTTK